MTSAPDARESADSTLPRDPADYAAPRRPGFGAAFWASIVLGLVLIAAGAIIGFSRRPDLPGPPGRPG